MKNGLYQKFKEIIRRIIDKDTLELLYHSKNYLSSQVFIQGLAFLSIPIFTRLLIPEEYGILAIFESIVLISTIFIGLNIHGSLHRYYFENVDDYDRATGSFLCFISFYGIAFLFVTYLIKDKLSVFFGVPSIVITLAILASFIAMPTQIYLSHLRASKNSKQVFRVRIIMGMLTLAIAIPWIWLLSHERYFGRIYALLIISTIFAGYAWYKLLKISNLNIKWKYVKYALLFGVPLIPHAISRYILSFFDRVIIQQLSTFENTGVYSLAYNVGLMMSMIVVAMNTAWAPLFMQNMNEKKYNKILSMSYHYSKYVYYTAIGLIFFSGEIVFLLASPKYFAAMDIVPIIVIGYVFVFLYMLYAQYSFYAKKTYLVSINTLVAAGLNIGLNYWLIPIYGYKIAAYTTVISFAILFIMHYLNARFILKGVIIPLKRLLPNLFIVLLISFSFVAIRDYDMSLWFITLLKILLLLILGYLWFLKGKDVFRLKDKFY